MARSFFYKLLISVFTFVIILSSVYFMCGAAEIYEDVSLQKMAEKNSDNVKGKASLPKSTAKADLSVMRTEPRRITEDDLRSVYIGGTRYDFPCTLADLNKEYEVFIWSCDYKEELNKYKGLAFIYCNSIPILTAKYHCPDKGLPFDKCVVTSLTASFCEYSEEYTPQIVFAGMDIYSVTNEEIRYLTGIEEAGYMMDSDIYFHIDDKYKGYVNINVSGGGYECALSSIEYIPDYDESELGSLGHNGFKLLRNEILLPDDYSPEKYPAPSFEEYPEIIYNEENITEEICKYNLTANELMALTGSDIIRIYGSKFDIPDSSPSDGSKYGILKCWLDGIDEKKYGFEIVRFSLLVRDGDSMGNAAVFNADEDIMKIIDRERTS